MNRLEALRRYKVQSLDAAALVGAIATSNRQLGHSPTLLESRQDTLMVDLLHDFAFKARKYFELAVREEFIAAASLKDTTIHGWHIVSAPVPGRILGYMKWYSLWDVLGRLIHSDMLFAERGVVIYDEQSSRVMETLPWSFRVRSDWDKGETDNSIPIDALLKAYLAADAEVDGQLMEASS